MTPKVTSPADARSSVVALAAYNVVSWLSLAALGFATTTIVYRVASVSGYGIWATALALRNVTLFLDGGPAFGVIRDAARLSAERALALPRIQAAQLGYRALAAAAVLIGIAGSWIPGALLGLTGSAAGQAQALSGPHEPRCWDRPRDVADQRCFGGG